MRSLLIGIGLALAGAGVVGLVACQSSPPPATSGALPAPRGDVTPRLNSSTYVAHGHLLEQQGTFEQAVEQYRRALEITPNLSAARNRLAITLNKLGRYSEAAAEFRVALVQQPTAAHLYNNLGFSLYLAGEYVEAEAALARAIELQPNFSRAHMNHGLVLGRLGQDEEALTDFSLAGPEPDAYYNLAMVQADGGRYAAAAHSLERALQLNADFAAARTQLREIARLAAEEEEAEAAELAAARQSPAEPEPVLDSAESAPVTDDAVLVFDAEPTAIEESAKLDDPVPLANPDCVIAVDAFVTLFDELVMALAHDAPWYEETLCRVYEWVGVPAD